MKKQYAILLLLLSWLCGFACCSIFMASTRKANLPVPNNAAPIVQVHNAQADNLDANHNNLQRQLAATATKLWQVTGKNQQLEQRLQATIYNREKYKQQSDTVLLPSACDTLAKEATVFIATVKEKDSLQENMIQVLGSVVKNRDSLVATSKTTITLLQEGWGEATKLHRRQLRKQRLKSTLKTVAWMTVSAVAAGVFSH